MAKLVKWIVFALLGVVGLVIALVVAIVLLVDPNDYRDDIGRLVQENTGQELVIEGDISLSFFPWLGLDLGRTRLENRDGFGDQPFVQVESVGIAVRLLPLLRREVVMDTIRMDGLVVHLVLNEQGEGNWELDLPESPEEVATEPPEPDTDAPDDRAPPVVVGRLGGVELTNLQLIYEDRQANTRQEFGPANVYLGEIDLDDDISLRADWVAALDGDLRMEGELDSLFRVSSDFEIINLALRDLQVRTFSPDLPPRGLLATIGAVVDVDLGRDTARLEALRLRAAGLDLTAQADVSNLTGDLSVDGRFDLAETDVRGLLEALGQPVEDDGPYPSDLALSGRFGLADDALTITELALGAAGLALSAEARVADLSGTPTVNGRFELAEANLRQVLQALNQEVPETADPDVLTVFSMNGEFTANEDSAQVGNLAIRLDDTSIAATASVTEFDDPMIGFNVEIDRLDADRYLPPPSEDDPAPVEAVGEDSDAEPVELPMELLRSLRLDGNFRLGELIISELLFEDLHFTVSADNGLLRVHPIGARLYGGAYSGDIRVDASGDEAVVSVNERVEGVQARPLVQHFMGKDLLEGTGNLTIQAEAEGVEVMDLVRTLVGEAEFRFTDGAVMGMNIAQMMRDATARLQGQRTAASAEPERTDFAELVGRLVFDRGIVRNESLNAQSPLLRVTGGGEANLLEQTVDYRLVINLVGTLQGQGGESLDNLRRLPIPLRIRGSLLEPSISLDLQAALTDQQRQRLRDEEEALRQRAREAEDESRARLEQEQREAEERLRREQERAEQRLRDEAREQEGEVRDRARDELRRLIR